MHRGLADAEGAGGAAHGGTVFGDVQRQLQGALVDVPFHTASLPVMSSHAECICAGRAGYEKEGEAGKM